MGFRSFAVAGGALLFVGCSVLTSLDDLSGTSTTDGATPDGGNNTGNLAVNGSFDDSQGGCGPNWGNGYGMTFTRVSPGRTGPYACEVCVTTGSSGSYALASQQEMMLHAGVSYYGEAWLSVPDGGVAPAGGVGMLVNYDIDAGITSCSGVGSLCQGSIVNPAAGSWVKTTAAFVANGDGTATIDIHSFDDTPQSCFIVDDVAFFAQ